MKFVAKIVYCLGIAVGVVKAILLTIGACVMCLIKRSWQPLDDLIAEQSDEVNEGFEEAYRRIMFQK